MKLITLATITLTLLTPVTHGETLSVEQIREMQNVRNEAHRAQERSDTSLILALCASNPVEQCVSTTRKLIMKYKANVLQLHENDKKFTERMKASGQ